MYRAINQKAASLPASNQAVKKMVSNTKNIDLTPQESEQLSEYVADDGYVQRQKEDIRELTSLFKDMMSADEEGDEYSIAFKKAFKPQPGFRGSYKFRVESRRKPLVLRVNSADLEFSDNSDETVDVEMQLGEGVFDDIIAGRMSFQRAFMAGDMKMKGDFMTLRTLDQIFVFGSSVGF